MHKVNEELIGKDSVKKKAAFLWEGVSQASHAEAQTFATDEPQNDDEDNLESPDSQRPIEARSLPQNHAGEEEIIDDEDVEPSEDTIKRGSAWPDGRQATALSSEQVEYPHQPAMTAAAQAGRKRGDNRNGIPEPQAGVKSAPLEPQGWMENLELILDIPLQIDVQIGKTKVPLREVLELSSGSIIKLNKSESDSVDLLINGKLVAEGQIVLTDQNTLGIQVTSIVNRVERIRSLR